MHFGNRGQVGNLPHGANVEQAYGNGHGRAGEARPTVMTRYGQGG
jgi:hypothetical protein